MRFILMTLCLLCFLSIQQLVKKLKLQVSLFFRERSCFSFAATFMPLINCGDVLCMHATSQGLKSTVFHRALRFTTNIKALTHYCTLYALVGWPVLTAGRQNHRQVFGYKSQLLSSILVRLYTCEKVKKLQSTLCNPVSLSLRHAAGELVSGGEGLFKAC